MHSHQRPSRRCAHTAQTGGLDASAQSGSGYETVPSHKKHYTDEGLAAVELTHGGPKGHPPSTPSH
ncbi:hypothetical protein AMTR_s00003p00270340 [Amborella trichopoda]|uniref:Uncharacterized protein n=1 Tax=Amborella trichopoda TaxID=13333 RepID=W1P941_AMBTC|nr:hypothetical protein AMTR_s00003p00270340 [Amborella trichopoda]